MSQINPREWKNWDTEKEDRKRNKTLKKRKTLKEAKNKRKKQKYVKKDD